LDSECPARLASRRLRRLTCRLREAVAELTSGAAIDTLPPPAEKPTFDFADIELAPDMERVILYLNKTRGLSVELITELIRRLLAACYLKK